MIEASEYGRALFLLTEERGSSARVWEDISAVRAALAAEPSYIRLLDTPAIAIEEKRALIDTAFGKLDTDLVSFLKILTEKHSMYRFETAARAFGELHDEARGICRAEAITAVPLGERQSRAITEKLSRITGKTVILKNTVDPEVLGGITLRYLGKQEDGTLRSRLVRLERSISDIIV